MLNRLIPISIVLFRYTMVCKAVLTVNMGESVLSNIVYKTTLLIPIFFGVVGATKLNKVRFFLICMGREERFMYETSDFFKQSRFGQSIKLPFWDPFRLSFNFLSFSFLLVVPVFYFLIYNFRNKQTTRIQG